MKTQFRLLAGVALITLATGTVWAKPENGCEASDDQPKKCAVAPEIDASSGASAIALLTGVVFLISERSRRRRSPSDEEHDKDNSDGH